MAVEIGNELKDFDHIRAIESLAIINHGCSSGPSHQRTQKLRAARCTDEIQKIIYLVDAHVPKLRERTAFLYERLAQNEECEEVAEEYRKFKKLIFPSCNRRSEDAVRIIKQQVAELPKEWTIVQLTSQYIPEEHLNLNPKRFHTGGLHISVFNCGTDSAAPFLVTIPPPSVDGVKLELMQTQMNGLAKYQERLSNTANRKFFKSHQEKLNYLREREEIELCLKETMQNVQDYWLGGWRCLFSGKYQDNAIENFIRFELEHIIKNVLAEHIVSNRAKDLLYYVTKGASYLNNEEIISILSHIFGEQAPLKKLARLISKLNVEISSKFCNLLKHPLMLVVDESLDNLHWEMMDILKDESVSRVPSLHFAYFLYKAHEKSIENGYKIVTDFKNGTYIVNPDSNLEKMEIRMMSFYKYWLQDWKGINNRRPSSQEFCDMLKDSELFSYSGHGNGTHIVSLSHLKDVHIKAVAMMFGCASTRIQRSGPQADTFSSYHVYLTSRCPGVLGMLWPVQDVQTDQLTAYFLSSWIPSTAPIPWASVEKTMWIKAQQTGPFTSTGNKAKNQVTDVVLSRALVAAKQKLDNYLCSAACVVRGLPIKIKTSQFFMTGATNT